jgi:hypothetical protein
VKPCRDKEVPMSEKPVWTVDIVFTDDDGGIRAMLA